MDRHRLGPRYRCRHTSKRTPKLGETTLGRTATVTVTYTGSCGTQTDSFTVVLTEDVTVIAYVDYAKTIADSNNPSSLSYMDFGALNSDPGGGAEFRAEFSELSNLCR